jgi:hypothetical protein
MILKSRMTLLRNPLRKRFLLVAIIGLILVGVAAPLARVAPSRAQEPQPRDGRRLSFLVEQGYVLPSQLLVGVENEGAARTAPSDRSNRLIFAEPVRLPQRSKTDAPFDVTFTISGNARFESAQGLIAVTGAENGVIVTPPIVAGTAFGESFVRVMVDGQTVIENLRVATLEAGSIGNLTRIIGADDPGLIVLGDHYAVLDESKMRETTQTVTGRVELPSKIDGKSVDDTWNRVAPKIDQQRVTSGVCIRSPFGPGWVNWHWSSSNPWATNGWAYKPETLNVVYRADDLAGDAIDGLYKISWGCGTAFKVPDSCTVDMYQGDSTIYYCCNAAAWAAGHRAEFVSSSALGGPPCPW